MKTRYQYLIGGTTIGAAIAALTFLLWPSPPAPPTLPADEGAEVVAVGGGPPSGLHTGWVRDDEQVKAVVASLPIKSFGDTPAGQVAEPLPKAVYLWDAYRKQFGRPPPPQDQGQVGSCVSFGTSRAVEMSLINEIVEGGANFDFKPITEEIVYAGSRVTIGGGQLRGDGSVGAWAAEYVTKYGTLPRGKYGSTDCTAYSESRCRQWGDAGVPSSLVPEVKKYPVGSTTQVKSWDDAKKALAQRYGIAVCSDQGFTMRRDSRGVCRPSGSWAHCMALLGYHTDTDGKEYGYIQNSWTEAPYSGPLGWGNPGGGGFWADSATINRMIRQNDTWAFSAVKGFPAKRLDWAARPQPAHPIFAFGNIHKW